ncbi:Protein of unknown function [Bacillus cytotoxicus]|uniref:Uncharacterized protein n=1 Tax=Bacillus cytotoxicus TaxID=580165 RepID=A0AAX2CIK3_9BACI|nr:Protein of unknown function [Bacillus cytotoxicus]
MLKISVRKVVERAIEPQSETIEKRFDELFLLYKKETVF